ncbi:serine/threonine-protein kinase HipA [Chitinophaga jiangningensis]|uniref:Serine/threonine-protein kinase HipA n=1 Tax=Chitinophaga jiangningensis TaxID=1419482 RepID=A0A1M6VDF0_9BACT|nr:HipA domain-containing protein [Chitinophaga jiangningensis]SHK79411.1 serine/threonine-protein kinase HipA [Chitinophaga jiangningensis]
MNNKCLYCYKPLLSGEKDYHSHCSRKFFGTEVPPLLPYSIEDITALANQIVLKGETVPGVQPKLSLEVVKEAVNNQVENRLTIIGVLGGHYIFKPPSVSYSQMPENEHLTMLMAKEIFKLDTADSTLVRLQSGELGYLTKRMDRTLRGEKLHMLDMFQVLDAYDKYVGSMEKIGKAIKEYTDSPLLNLAEYFQLVLFCFLTGNNDMHLKNFSFLSKEKSLWELAPAYDLLNATIVNPEDTEELALTLNAKKRRIKRKDFMVFGQNLGLTERQIESRFSAFAKYIPAAFSFINESFLSHQNKKLYQALLAQRWAILSS